MNKKSVHQFDVQKMNGESMSLREFDNKVLLIVNTATDCGFTPQLKELESLRRDFAGEDFEILAFPSNDFGGQEPREGNAILEYCVLNYDVHFPIFDKTRVRGNYAHPLFKFLSDKKLNGHVAAAPRWNFHKYLINRQGEVIDFFYPFTKPNSSKLRKRILHQLKQEII
ncbi:glutathione peroxidase [Flavihumibacter sp. R14]|nr:glutathione peroxidase [Flavihumibacter soli]